MAYAKPGENVKIKLKGIDEENEKEIRRGFMICNNDDYCPVCFEIETEL